MVVMEMIDRNLIFTNINFNNKKDVFNFSLRKLKDFEYINDEKIFLEEINRREAILPTSLGFGVAIPHGRSESVKSPFILFIKSEEPFYWNADDKEQTDLIFMIGIPDGEDAGNIHLRILSSISKKLMHEDFRDALRTGDADNVYKLMYEIDQTITGGIK